MIRLLSLYLVAIVSLSLTTGCGSEKVVRANADPALKAVEGKQLTLKVDCYIFMNTDTKEKQPSIAPITPVPRYHVPDFPSTANPKDLGKNLGGSIILGIVPRGTKVHVVGLTYRNSFEIGNLGEFQIALEDAKWSQKWPVLNGFWLTDNHMGPPPRLYNELIAISEAQ